ncbi:unnamed protein product [Ectocarpus sp. CCAP 1310/34]|nr:unnamed protein product [Ectocarpus sp. CCAP 1310/34]
MVCAALAFLVIGFFPRVLLEGSSDWWRVLLWMGFSGTTILLPPLGRFPCQSPGRCQLPSPFVGPRQSGSLCFC